MSESYGKKCAVVTGSSRGIGAATIEEFAKKNYNVVINYVQHEKTAEDLKKKIENLYNVQAILVKADISIEEEVFYLLEETKKIFKRIDVLVNNAGIAIDTTLEDKTVDNFNKIINTNLIGTFLCCKYIGTFMKEQGFGSIVNIASGNAIDAYYPYSMDYDASKAGVISLTHNFALLYAKEIHVNCVAPGWVNTDTNKEMDEEFYKKECNHILLNRFAEPKEIAETIVFVAEASYINDSIIKVDGGRRIC